MSLMLAAMVNLALSVVGIQDAPNAESVAIPFTVPVRCRGVQIIYLDVGGSEQAVTRQLARCLSCSASVWASGSGAMMRSAAVGLVICPELSGQRICG
jgi:hypothetical protein